MEMLEALMKQSGGSLDLGALAGQFGLDPVQVQGALGQLLPQMADPSVNNAQALAGVSGQTGISAGTLAAMLPMLIQAVQGAEGSGGGAGGVLGQLISGMSGPGAGGTEGLLGSLGTMLDRDGDGSPLNDIMGMFNQR
jgi:hypothetical protein